MKTEGADITITLTKEEVLALAEASASYIQHIPPQSESAQALRSYAEKILPHIQQKIKEQEEAL